MDRGIKTQAYWSTYGTLTTTATTTLIDPIASGAVYLCYGYLDIQGPTTTKKISVIVASTTTNTLWTVDCTANNVGTHGLIFGEKGLRCTTDATLYLINSMTCAIAYGFTGYTDY
jgi:hypothetical protein